MRSYKIWVVMGALAVAGCGQKKEEVHTASTEPSAASSVAPPVPDVGTVGSEKVTAFGLGKTAGEAMSEALKMALLQVNGAVIDSESVSAKYGLDVSLDKDSASLRANEFAELVRQRSGGVIQSLRVVSMEEPTEKGPNRYKVTIEANIAKFKPSADMQKVKVVIGPVEFDEPTVEMGDKEVSSADVAATLRQRVNDALVQTGRFAVLDRDFSPEIARELDGITSGQAPSAELTKLSQAASADLVWSAHVSNFAYNRHARKLVTSDRELVSYSGGWGLSEKLVNVATRQVTVSDSLKGSAPDTEPTTLGTGVDGDKVLADMEDDAVKSIVSSILQHMFPLTVVSRDGTNVVLSQGGQAVKEGGRYAVVLVGNEMKDPQTGQSLGRVESPCCDLVVDRVSPNLSYGHLENVHGSLDGLPTGALQVRGEAKAAAPVAISTNSTPAPVATQAVAKPAKARTTVETDESEPPKKDDKW